MKARLINLSKKMYQQINLLMQARLDLVTILAAILMSWQLRKKLQCFCDHLILNNFRKMTVLIKI